MISYYSSSFDTAFSFRDITTSQVGFTTGTNVFGTTVASNYTSSTASGLNAYISTNTNGRSSFNSSTDGFGSTHTFSSSTSFGTLAYIKTTGFTTTSTSDTRANTHTTTATTQFPCSTTSSGFAGLEIVGTTVVTTKTISATSSEHFPVLTYATVTSSYQDCSFPVINDLVLNFVSSQGNGIVQSIDVMWLPTYTDAISTTALLTDVADMISDNTTIHFSQFKTSTTGSIVTSASSFPTTSWSTSFASSGFTLHDVFSPLTESFSPPTMHQVWVGNFAVDSTTGRSTSGYDTSSFSQPSASASITAKGLSTLSTTRHITISAKETTTVNLDAHEVVNDGAWPDSPNIAGLGRKTITVSSTAFTTAGYTTATDTLIATSVLDSSATASGGFTRWYYSMVSLAQFSASPHSFYLPDNGSGFVSFNTAGEQASNFLGITAAMPAALGGAAFSIGDILSLAARNGLSAIYRDPATFYLQGVLDSTSFFDATAQFSTDSVPGLGAILSVTAQTDTTTTSGEITIGLVSGASTVSQQSMTGQLAFFGGRQSYSAGKATARVATGPRGGTTISSNGVSTTTVVNRTASTTATMPTSALAFESALPFYSVIPTTENLGIFFGTTFSKFAPGLTNQVLPDLGTF